MEYRTISTKVPSNELTLFKVHCEKKGVTSAHQLRMLILKDMQIKVPNKVAGKNKVKYYKNTDSFDWLVELDTGEKIVILKDISPSYIENLYSVLKDSLDERDTFIHKKTKDSIAIPTELIGE